MDVELEMVREKRRREYKMNTEARTSFIRQDTVHWKSKINSRFFDNEPKIDKTKPLLWDRTDLVCMIPMEYRQ